MHVLGAVGVYVSLGVEIVAMKRLRLTPYPAAARTWLDVLRSNARLAPVSMVVMLGAGIWMMVVRWGHQPWIVLGFAGLIGMALLGGIVTRRGTKRVNEALRVESAQQVSAGFRTLTSSRGLTLSLHLRTALGVGILALMTMKPGYAGSLVIMVVALLPGLIGSARGAARATVGMSGLENNRASATSSVAGTSNELTVEGT